MFCACHCAEGLHFSAFICHSFLLCVQPLSERMDQFMLIPPSQKVTLAPLPPEYRPIACKPLFFDLALNHIEFPSLESKVEKKAAGGLTGFMKGLLWGKPSS